MTESTGIHLSEVDYNEWLTHERTGIIGQVAFMNNEDFILEYETAPGSDLFVATRGEFRRSTDDEKAKGKRIKFFRRGGRKEYEFRKGDIIRLIGVGGIHEVRSVSETELLTDSLRIDSENFDKICVIVYERERLDL